MKNRFEKLYESLDKLKLRALLISDLTNIRYLTGFTGTYGFLLVADGREYLFTDSRYFERASKEAKVVDIRLIKDKWPDVLLKYNFKKLGFEANSISYAGFKDWKKKLKGIKLVSTINVVEKIRQIKKPKEIDLIKNAVKIAEGILKKLKFIPGVSEMEIKRFLDNTARQHDSAEPSFTTIAAFGMNSSMPHAVSGTRKLKKNDTALIDFGIRANGYCSDLTRTYAIGKITQKFKDIYNIVLTAQKLAIENIKPGVKICDIDNLARGFIKKQGFGEFFGHSLGHGIGLAVHEIPKINLKNKSKLQEGMVFSIEPGIYIPGWGGVRVEDMVLVKKGGCEVLTKIKKDI